MFNRKYRSYVRNRPRFFKKLRRSGRLKGAQLPFHGSSPSHGRRAVLPYNYNRSPPTKRQREELGNLRGRGFKRKMNHGAMLKSGMKLLTTVGTVGRGIYSLAKRNTYKRFRIKDSTDYVLPMFDVREEL